jgi:hypothetical protein
MYILNCYYFRKSIHDLLFFLVCSGLTLTGLHCGKNEPGSFNERKDTNLHAYIDTHSFTERRYPDNNSPVIEKQDSVNEAEMKRDSVSVSSKQQKKSRSFFVKIGLIFSKGFKGSYGNYDFVTAVEQNSRTPVLFVYQVGLIDSLGIGNVPEKLLNENLERCRIAFSPYRKGEFWEICSIEKGVNDEFEIYITIKQEGDCLSSSTVIYSFGSKMKLLEVRFTKAFRSEFAETEKLSEEETAIRIRELSEELKGGVKYWDGRGFSKSYKYR